MYAPGILFVSVFLFSFVPAMYCCSTNIDGRLLGIDSNPSCILGFFDSWKQYRTIYYNTR